MTSATVKNFLGFLEASPTPWHCVDSSKALLRAAGFEELHESDSWAGRLKCGHSYYFTRNQSTVVAFSVGGQYLPGHGANIIGAHTDSPNLRLKPVSSSQAQGYQQLRVVGYGGGLWHTWFDRDLSVAGRVVVDSGGGKFEHRLVRLHKPVVRVPNLCIHLRTDRSNFDPNLEKELGCAILSTAAMEQLSTPHPQGLLREIAAALNVDPTALRDFELCLYDVQPPAIGGLHDEFIFSARLDNQAMSFAALHGLLESVATLRDESRLRVVALFDHEEVGSASQQGAASNMMERFLRRVFRDLGSSDGDAADRAFRDSYLVSADMSHAVHPNYADKHEDLHRPAFRKGVVVKRNDNQRYATSAVTAFLLKETAKRAGTPLQEYVVRNDSPCGSTIGPILAAKCGLRTIDVGAPQLAMHSIREMCAVEDMEYSWKLFETFFNEFTRIDAQLTID